MSDFNLQNALYYLGQVGGKMLDPNIPMGRLAGAMGEVSKGIRGGEGTKSILDAFNPQQPQQAQPGQTHGTTGSIVQPQSQAQPQTQVQPQPQANANNILNAAGNPQSSIKSGTVTYHPNGEVKSITSTGDTPASIAAATNGGPAGPNQNFLAALQRRFQA
jgi:hypothetical protein